MNPLEEWIDQVCAELDLPPDVDRTLLLDIARDVAHGVARPAAPLTTYLVGLAAGRAGGGPAATRQAAEGVQRALATWAAGHPPPP